MILFIIGVCHLLGVLSATHAIMSTRTSQGAIAWVISLITFPYIAVPAYWILGRNKFQGYVIERQGASQRVQGLSEKTLDAAVEFFVPDADKNQASLAAEKLANIPILKGNRVSLLIDGNETFNSILEGIDKAEHYILFQFFIVHDDQIGRKVKTHLINKAKQGVQIYFLYDEIGSHDLPASYTEELRTAGIKVYDFHTRKGARNRFQINFRNHRKVVVVDGRVSWIGGHNVGDEYLGRDKKFGHWRDTHVRIQGPATLAAQLSFIEDWHWATEALLDLNWVPFSSKQGNHPVLIVPTGPADRLETASLMFHHTINSAQKRIWISSPYFVPDEAVMAALQLAGLRGVDVRILIPDKPDHLLVYLAAFYYVEDASSTGVRIFRYTDGFLHGKAMLIDGHTAAIGTANFDNRSFRLNFEITAFVEGSDFAAEVEQMFIKDFSQAREMEKNTLETKPFWFKLAVGFARLTSPVQ